MTMTDIDFKKARKLIFSSPLQKGERFAKLAGRKVCVKGAEYMQFEGICENQAFHENVPIDALRGFFGEKIQRYRQADIYLEGAHYMAFNKGGEASFHKAKDKAMDIEISGHNRRKNYMINEGDDIPAFVELGICTTELKVVSSMYGKFKQINRFVELFDDMSGTLEAIYGKFGRIEAIDFGCGKSYLTFILYFYLAKKFPEEAIHITGVDLKKKVVEDCNALARKHGYKNLSFECGDIDGYAPKRMPNAVVSLHGCDTATDHALRNALMWGSELIFAAPCCEHEINAQIDIKPMHNILKYGIAKERFSALMTNAIRCNILEINGYKTELVEFVDIAHSPKNLLIRATKTENKADRSALRRELEETLEKFGISQTLYRLLYREG